MLVTWHTRVDAMYTKGDTVKLRDTIVDIVLLPVKETLKRTDTVYLPILIDTTIDKTIKGDTVPVLIPITSKEYKTNDYRAIVSGYKPSLDFMEVYGEKEIITLKPKNKRWGLGLQTGCSYPGGWYVGVGISYNLVMW